MATLRPYAARDWPHFYALELETAEVALDSEATEAERAQLRERFLSVLATRGMSRVSGPIAPGSAVWVLEGPDQGYLGHLWLTEQFDPVLDKRILEVTSMGIVREHRGQGSGRVLMQKAETEARARGIWVLALSVSGNNRRAFDLYRDLGYEATRGTMRKRLHQG